LTACSGKTPPAQPASAPGQPATPAPVVKKVFRTAAVGKFSTLDPAKIETVSERMIVSNLVETLFQQDVRSGQPVPRACGSYEVSPDGLKWKFILRKDLFWSNGKKIKGRDYVAALRRLLKPKTAAKIATKLTSIKNAQEIIDGAFYNPDDLGLKYYDQENQSEVEITLIKPDPFLLFTLSQPETAPINSADYDIREDEIFSMKQWVSSGPFVISQRSPSVYILQKNHHHRYYNSIKIDEVVFFTLGSVIEGEKMFMSGMIDQFGYTDLNISERTTTTLAGTGYVKFQPDFKTVFLRLNINQSPLNQFKLRQALAMGLDQNALIESVALVGEKKAQSLISDETKFYNPPHGYYANPTAAIENLQSMGFCEKDGCGLLPKITILYPEVSSMRKIAGALVNQLKKSLQSNQIEAKSIDSKTFVETVQKGNYAIALDEIAVNTDDVFGFLHAFESGNPLSGGYINGEYDQLILQANATQNLVDTQKYYREAESMLLRDVVVIPLLYKTTPILLHTRVVGFIPNIWDQHPFELIQLK
jgi:oligopeptide transport system substrate-binding protein